MMHPRIMFYTYMYWTTLFQGLHWIWSYFPSLRPISLLQQWLTYMYLGGWTRNPLLNAPRPSTFSLWTLGRTLSTKGCVKLSSTCANMIILKCWRNFSWIIFAGGLIWYLLVFKSWNFIFPPLFVDSLPRTVANNSRPRFVIGRPTTFQKDSLSSGISDIHPR